MIERNIFLEDDDYMLNRRRRIGGMRQRHDSQ